MKTRIFFRIDGGGLAKESRHSLKGKKEEKKNTFINRTNNVLALFFLLVLDLFNIFSLSNLKCHFNEVVS